MHKQLEAWGPHHGASQLQSLLPGLKRRNDDDLIATWSHGSSQLQIVGVSKEDFSHNIHPSHSASSAAVLPILASLDLERRISPDEIETEGSFDIAGTAVVVAPAAAPWPHTLDAGAPCTASDPRRRDPLSASTLPCGSAHVPSRKTRPLPRRSGIRAGRRRGTGRTGCRKAPPGRRPRSPCAARGTQAHRTCGPRSS